MPQKTCDNSLALEVAQNLLAEVVGPASWASAPDSQNYGINQVRFIAGWLGKIELGPCEMASVEGELPIPLGCCGILGLDFLKLFDWDFNVEAEEAEVATVPRDLKGPVPFDLEGMHVATIMKVRLPTGLDLLASPIQVKLPGSEEEVEVMGIADLCAASTICRPLSSGIVAKQSHTSSNNYYNDSNTNNHDNNSANATTLLIIAQLGDRPRAPGAAFPLRLSERDKWGQH